jgi:hypothetical protein
LAHSPECGVIKCRLAEHQCYERATTPLGLCQEHYAKFIALS